jgi:hypothetical protein
MGYVQPQIPFDLQEILEWENQNQQRVDNYKNLYTQETAATLIDMASQYSWVNPQIIATMVLTGNQDLIHPIAIQAAEKMGEAGLSPADRQQSERVLQAIVRNAENRGT